MTYVHAADARDFLVRLKKNELADRKVDLFCIDPPYFGVVKDTWDNQWKNQAAYVAWLVDLLTLARSCVAPRGSLLCFGGIGEHDQHPIFEVIRGAESVGWCYRNWITWKKRRAYGKEKDYLFCREEILWYSASEERTEVTFNIPLLNVKRGYAGWDPKHPAKSEYKRVSNVWDDIPELMHPKRYCQKPDPLYERLLNTHSNPGDLVVDFFAGYGGSGQTALRLGRSFLGCEAITSDAEAADARCDEAVRAGKPKTGLLVDILT